MPSRGRDIMLSPEKPRPYGSRGGCEQRPIELKRGLRSLDHFPPLPPYSAPVAFVIPACPPSLPRLKPSSTTGRGRRPMNAPIPRPSSSALPICSACPRLRTTTPTATASNTPSKSPAAAARISSISTAAGTSSSSPSSSLLGGKS